jgi:predicted metalloprotease with PDZ domain
MHIFILFILHASLRRAIFIQDAAPAGPSVVYNLRVDPMRPHRYSIRVTAPRPEAPTLDFAIPAWTPGYYQIMHFENGIDSVRARDETGRALAVSHSARRLWTVSTSGAIGRTISLTYDVAGSDKGYGFFGSMLDSRRQIGYINGPSAFMYIPTLMQASVTLTVSMPVQWRCATPLRLIGSSVYTARNYDELVDSPIQLGDFDSFEFAVGAIPFRCILVGDRHVDAARVSAALARIAHEAIGVFGSAPFKQYLFFFHIGDAGFAGGLEHHDSTVIHLDDPIADGNDDEFLTTAAHELFHAWNVKRLRPAGLGPFDYDQAVRTPSLWFAEGVTDYYADLLPVRAGLRSTAWYAQQLVDRIRQLDSTPARVRVTLEQASRQAWEGQSEGFGGLSYYLKGSLVGCFFDLRIRIASHGDRCLDDVLRDLYHVYGQHDHAYPDGALLEALNRVSRLDMTADYRKYVAGVEDIAWNEVLPQAGYRLYRQADGYLGVSFVPDKPEDETDDRDVTDRPAIVQRIEADYPAARMDLRTDDRIVTIDGRPVNYGLAGAVIRSLPAGVPVRIVVERHGRTLELLGETTTQYSHETLGFEPIGAMTQTTGRILAGIFASLLSH